jgi:hypothetical protein
MFTPHRLVPAGKLNCPHAVGTHTFSPQRAESFRHILLLPSPSLVYDRRKLPNLRVSLGACAAQLQNLRLRIRSHAGACPPPSQRTSTGHAGRCAEVAKARSIAALAWERRAFLAKAVLRFQHSQLSAVCREAALYSSQSGGARVVRASGGLGVEQFSPLRNRLRPAGGDRVGMDGTKTRTIGGKTLPRGGTAPLKPKPGLSGPPVLPKMRLRVTEVSTRQAGLHTQGLPSQ